MSRHIRFILFATLLLLAVFTKISLQELLVVALAIYGFDFYMRYQKKQAAQPLPPDHPETAADLRAALRLHPTSYYNNLTEAERRKFEERVINFILPKRFVPRGSGMEVTTEMKVQIAASAVQLTFGLEEVYFTHFKTILLYPDRYYSTIFKQYHCGEVNMRGLIVFSWRDFAAGNQHPEDGLNLGLHEMAHALHLENSLQNEEVEFLNKEYLRCWASLAEAERTRMQVEKSIFTRLCAAPDEHEFFAVAVELFFELPLLLQQEHPEIYRSLAKLLNQDPASRQANVRQEQPAV